MSSYKSYAKTTLSRRCVSFDLQLQLPLNSPDCLFEEVDATGSWDVNPQNVRAPPRCVDHTYHDYSNFPEEELPHVSNALMNFPTRLHHILSDPENQHVSIVLVVCTHDACFHISHHSFCFLNNTYALQIISWMPHGRAWKIHDKDLLMVVPRYFVQTKYQSFTRQLNGWGFKRLHQSGNDFNAFYHECFLRCMPKLVVLMKRVLPNQGRLLPDVEGEPNFYQIDKYFKVPTPHDNSVIGSFEHEMKIFNETVGFKEETTLDTKIGDTMVMTTMTTTIIDKKRAANKNSKMSKKKKGGLLMRKMLQITSPATNEHPSIQSNGPPPPPTLNNDLTVDPFKSMYPAPHRYYPTLIGPPPLSLEQYSRFTNPIVSPSNSAEVEAYPTAASGMDLKSPPNFPDVNTYPFTQSVGLASKGGWKEDNYPVMIKKIVSTGLINDDQIQHCPILHHGFPGTMPYDSPQDQDDFNPPTPFDAWHSVNSRMTKSGDPMPYGPPETDEHTRFNLQPLQLYVPTMGTFQKGSKVADSMEMNDNDANRLLYPAYHSALTHQDDDADEYQDDPLAFDQDEWIGFE